MRGLYTASSLLTLPAPIMTFFVGLTRDLLTPGGEPSFGTAPLALLSQPGLDLKWEFIPESVTEITPELMARYDGIYVNTPRVTAASVAGPQLRTKIIARHGVGYDSVDVKALADKGVITTNTPVAIQRPVSGQFCSSATAAAAVIDSSTFAVVITTGVPVVPML